MAGNYRNGVTEKIKARINKIGNPHNIPMSTIYQRVKKGSSIDDAITKPLANRYQKSKNRIFFENHPNPYNLDYKLIKNRLRLGWDIKRAMETEKGLSMKDFPKIQKGEIQSLKYPKEAEKFNKSNPLNLNWQTVVKRLELGWSYSEAIGTKVKGAKPRQLFEESENKFNLDWQTVNTRIQNGKSFDEAMSYPSRTANPEFKDAFEQHKNPYGLKWSIVYNRMRSGEDFETAMSYPIRVDPNRIKFDSHENIFNLRWGTVKHRLSKGQSFEEAMSYPAGITPYKTYKNGWLMFEGSWTSVNELEMIYDKDTTENMLKTGIEAEKLFKRKND